MRTIPLSRRPQTSLRFYALLPLACIVCGLNGCGSAPTSAPVVSTPPVSTTPVTTPNVRPKFAYTGNQGASLSGYSIDPSTGALTPLTGFPLAVGISPENITHDPQNRFLFASDISANMLHVYAINSTTGAVSEISPSPYNTMIESESVLVDPSGTHLYLYRTGSSASYPGVAGNQIVAYNLSSTGVLSAVKGSPFPVGLPGATFLPSTGMVINPNGNVFYLQDLFNISTFGIDSASGALSLPQTLPLTSQLGEGIALDPAGNNLYAIDRYSILLYGINPATGLLTLKTSIAQAEPGGASTIALSPNGNFAYTIENNSLVAYAVNAGAFVHVGATYPGIYGLQIAVDPSGNFVYVPQACSSCPSGLYNVIHQFSIGKTGGLTPLSTSTVATGMTPRSITVTNQ